MLVCASVLSFPVYAKTQHLPSVAAVQCVLFTGAWTHLGFSSLDLYSSLSTLSNSLGLTSCTVHV